jgi:hypothetical membrane protein
VRRDVRTIAGSLCWIAALQWFPVQFIVQAAWTTPYSLAHNFISDLGAVHCATGKGLGYVCSPLHSLMNASFIVIGLLTLAGVVLLWNSWPRRRLVTVGMVLFAVFGVGKVVIGLDPEDVRLGVHALGSLGMLFGDVGAILLALGLWRPARGQALVFLVVGVVGVIAFFLQLSPHQEAVRGALERLADWPLPLWLGVLGCLRLSNRWPEADRAHATQGA